MILSNVEIQRALDERRLLIEPEPSPRSATVGRPECPYQTSAVDLRLGREISIYKGDTSPVVIDLTITLEIMNLGPCSILLRPEMPICQLIIEEVRGTPFRNDSRFQGRRRPAGPA